MAFDGAAWDETIPTNSNLANEIDDFNRDLRIGVRGRMAQEHLWPNSQSATNEAGLHRYITFEGQTASPGLVVGTNTQQGALYVDDTSKSLIFKDSAGGEITLSPGATDTGGLMPTGSMIPYAATHTPAGWLLCTGGAVNRTTYARLFNTISTIWGTGNGSTTFNLPDMQGYTPVGQSAAGTFSTFATQTGATSHTLTIAEMPAHTHNMHTDVNGGGTVDGHTGFAPNTQDLEPTSSTGGGGAHTNIQPSTVVRFIIKD